MFHKGSNNKGSLIHLSFLAVRQSSVVQKPKTEGSIIHIQIPRGNLFRNYSIFIIHFSVFISASDQPPVRGMNAGGVRVIPPKNGRGTYQSEPSPLVSSPSEIRIGRCYPIVLLTAASAARRTALVISSSSMKGAFSLPGTPSTCSRMNGTCMKPAGTLSQSP